MPHGAAQNRDGQSMGAQGKDADPFPPPGGSWSRSGTSCGSSRRHWSRSRQVPGSSWRTPSSSCSWCGLSGRACCRPAGAWRSSWSR